MDTSTKKRSPVLSIILPCYNTEQHLAQCLESIIAQSFTDFELLCLNDGSTDTTLEIIQSYAAGDERLRVIDKENQGYGATCNRGLNEARGAWISIIEPDDWIEPQMYEQMLAFEATFDKEIDVIKTPYWRISMPDTKKQDKLNCSYRRRIKPSQQPFVITEVSHLLTHHPSIWSALYRHQFLVDHHICFKEYPGAGWADNPFLIETLLQAKNIIYLDEPFYCYREDTPEKATQFAHQSTLLPLQRWHDMMDILEDLDVTEEHILRAHNSRGFTYLAGIIEEVPLENEAVFEEARRLFERMDNSLVLNDDEVSPATKKMFCSILGLPKPPSGRLRYARSLIRQGFYSLRNVGARTTLNQTTNYFKKRKKRSGGSFIGK